MNKIKEENQSEYAVATKYGIGNMFPRSIGLRYTDDKDDADDGERHQPTQVRTAEKIKEISDICIHGCPDCILLGLKSFAGQYKERYLVNKYLVDCVFSEKMYEISLDESAAADKVENSAKRERVHTVSGEKKIR